MKTNLLKKANETTKNEFIEMNKDELKTIHGGSNGMIVQNPDGTLVLVCCK